MAVSKHRKGPARWIAVAASGVATVGFWYVIVNGPHPINEAPPPAVSSQAAATPRSAAAVDRGFFSPSSSTQLPATQSRSRLRTRGS